MKLGFTGTQQGMTMSQHKAVKKCILELNPSEFHHGDCVGADEEFHRLCASQLESQAIIHPPENGSKRAFCKGTLRTPKPYLERNHNIVDEADMMIAAPATDKEVLRSGTWATIRYARKAKKDLVVVFPTGKIVKEKP